MSTLSNTRVPLTLRAEMSMMGFVPHGVEARIAQIARPQLERLEGPEFALHYREVNGDDLDLEVRFMLNGEFAIVKNRYTAERLFTFKSFTEVEMHLFDGGRDDEEDYPHDLDDEKTFDYEAAGALLGWPLRDYLVHARRTLTAVRMLVI